jgi:thymidylate kinase
LNRLSTLAQEIGLPEAERSARRFLPASCSRLAATLCLNGGIDEFLKNGKAHLWRASCFRHPLRLAHYLAKEGLRLVQRWFQPTGVLVAVLGPDGVGKSTMIEGLVKIMDIAFWRRHRLFHWRPNIIARKNSVGPVIDPHGKPDRGRLTSMAFLFVFFVDYWIGYLSSIRPLLAKSNLVIFDRYLHDVLVDSRRFRYGGPRWFAQMLCHLAPQPDLVILLDADAESISARKSELPNEEIQRQRKSYSQLRFRRVDITVVPTDGGIGFAIQASCCAVAEYMKRRFNARFLGWLSTANSTLEPK